VWLKEAMVSPDETVSYLAQLACWDLEDGGLVIPPPIAPTQPAPHNLELAPGCLLGSGDKEAEFATEWFLSNPNLDREEQEENPARLLDEAKDPQEAAWAVVEAAYDLMVAESPTYPGRSNAGRRGTPHMTFGRASGSAVD
jgi:hypothetical protein